MNKKQRNALITIAIGAIIWFMPVPAGVTVVAWHLAAVFIATVVGFILQPLPIGAVAFIAITFSTLSGLLKVSDALSGYGNSTIWLIVCAFLYSRGFIKTGLGKRIAYLLLSRFGKNTLSVAYVMSAADFIIAPFTPSNTARGGGIIYPIVNSVSLALGCDAKSGKNKRTGAFLMYSAYAAVITSACIFMTGASNNVLANTLTEQAFGQSLSWMSWFEVSIIPGLLLSIVTPYLLYKIIKPELTETPETLALAKKELGAMGAMTGKEKVLCVIFIACLVLWATGSIHHIDSAIVALLGLSAMLITHCIDWSDVTKQHGAWDVLVWMGVLVNMAAYLSKFGFMKWFAATMAAACAGMSWMTMLIVLCVIYTMAHYLLASNSAHIAAMFIAFMTILVAAGAPVIPTAIILAILCNSASFLTHYGCGVTPIFFGTGFMGQGEWWKIGFVITVMHIVVWMALGLPIMGILGMM